ncbi:MAG: sugar phosphate nucleotidyltransferase [Victivallaceae bacterium]|nr:sugar phosphate nucleotidyltransferase [Victivallaceae bacterium]
MAQLPVYAVIMAGGRGERFWPQSRASKPKQLLRLMGNLTMIEQAAERLLTVVDPRHILVIANQDYVDPMRRLLTKLPPENILGEIFGRDTGCCVALAAGVIRQRAADKPAVMVVSPADHVIRDIGGFRHSVTDAIEAAENTGKLVTLGIRPAFATTGFGYILPGEEICTGSNGTKFRAVRAFSEKPDAATAAQYVAEGRRWNSGLFVWRTDALMNELKLHAPALNMLAGAAKTGEKEHRIDRVMAEDCAGQNAISIDYALMEKSGELLVGDVDFDWLDVGSWLSIRNQLRAGENNNVAQGLYTQIDSHNCSVVTTPGHLVATIDVDDLIIVHTDDATLVCPSGSAQRVKELVRKLSEKPELRKFL